jgi:hypothetical protein
MADCAFAPNRENAAPGWAPPMQGEYGCVLWQEKRKRSCDHVLFLRLLKIAGYKASHILRNEA